MKKARVYNLNWWNGCWHKYTKQAS